MLALSESGFKLAFSLPLSPLSLSLSLSHSPELDFNHGVVLSNRPLNDGELFEVEISAMQARWSGSVELGVTTHK